MQRRADACGAASAQLVSHGDSSSHRYVLRPNQRVQLPTTGDIYARSNGYGDRNSDIYARTNSYSNSDRDSYGNTNCNGDNNGHADSYSYGHTNSYCYAYCNIPPAADFATTPDPVSHIMSRPPQIQLTRPLLPRSIG